MNLDKNSALPLHLQLTNVLRDAASRMHSGERFISENAICRKYRLSRVTVAHALNSLVNEGYLKRVRGSGTFVENPAPALIYFLLPCVDAVKYPLAAPGMHIYAGALKKSAELGCGLQTLIASTVNVPWEVDRSVLAALLPKSRLIVSSTWFYEFFKPLRSGGHEVVFIDTQAELSGEYRRLMEHWRVITVDRYGTMMETVRHLAAKGRRRIAFLHHYSTFLNPFLRGWRDALAQCGLEGFPELCFYSRGSDRAAENDFLHILQMRRENPFDAVITANNFQAQGVLRQLRRHSVLPGDVEVLSLNMGMEEPTHEFSAVDWPFQQAGEEAVGSFFQPNRPDRSTLSGKVRIPEGKESAEPFYFCRS